jgi:hypothetical protein
MNKPSTALIAVHGVGHHTAGETSATIAEQLQYFFPSQFGAFECTPLHIAVDADALAIRDQDSANARASTGRLPQGVDARARAASPAPHGADATDIDFTAITLAGGANYADTYSTTRMRCPHEGPHCVDLYEMHWADLSHGGTQGGLTALRQMMQLFLHVASLGRSALGTLLASRGKRDPIPVLSSVYGASAWGYWLLAVPIALGNLLLLCLSAAFLAHFVPDTRPGRIGTTVVAAILAACLVGMAFQRLMRREQASPLLQRIGLPLVWLTAICVAASGVLWDEHSLFTAPGVAFSLALPAALLLGTLLVRRYETGRPGATKWWSIMLAAGVLWGCAAPAVMRARQIPVEPLSWFMFVVEGNFAWLVSAWTLLALINLSLLATSLWTKHHCDYDDVRRSIDTGLIAAAVPPSLLLMVVLALWSAAWKMLDAGGFALMKTPVASLFSDKMESVSARMEQLINVSAGPAAMPFLLCLALALACSVVAVLPSVLAELLPPRDPADPARSLGLWRWLDQGFRLLQAAKWIVVCAFFLLLPAGAWLQYGSRGQEISYLGIALGGSALAFLSVTRLFGAVPLNRLSRTFARLRVVIDTAIDVDNWLRERPVGRTPRLRIMARYASLLRYLSEQDYERIVIVAHSQGTVITADLLRYLKARHPEFLGQLCPIDLLTFGSPLRQLYAARFPAIYGWARNPEPREAGVASWRNGYGSGDYVGRNLWDSTNRAPWQPGRTGDQKEFCTGALAHTRYFMQLSPDVARAITAAIVDANTRVGPDLRGAA